jgi:hypothetical protein
MRLRRMAPGHGYIIEEPKKAIPAELELRAAIDENILRALKDGATSAAEVVAVNHPGVTDPQELAVLESGIEVHLAKLAADRRAKKLKAGWVPC